MPFKNKIKQHFSVLCRGLIRLGLLPDGIIIKMDGGICSQMHFYMLGKALGEKCGCRVYYDIDWFNYCGRDTAGSPNRNFDLLKAFPQLDFCRAKGLWKRMYITSFWAEIGKGSNYDQIFETGSITHPAYLDGYFHESDSLFLKYYRDTFKTDCSLLPEENLKILERIGQNDKETESCSIHIRRGDLSVYNSVYGNPVSVDYIAEAAKLLKQRVPGVKFFIFSDDPEWVRQNIVTSLSKYEVEVVDANSADNGWRDLLLMSRCRHHITSQGSMGKYAAMLRKDEDMNGIVVLPPNKTSKDWEKRFEMSITLGKQ